jgi:hypothetical protein
VTATGKRSLFAIGSRLFLNTLERAFALNGHITSSTSSTGKVVQIVSAERISILDNHWDRISIDPVFIQNSHSRIIWVQDSQDFVALAILCHVGDPTALPWLLQHMAGASSLDGQIVIPYDRKC